MKLFFHNLFAFHKRTVGIVAALVIALSVPVTLILVQQQQITRQNAAELSDVGPTPAVSFNVPSPPAGQTATSGTWMLSQSGTKTWIPTGSPEFFQKAVCGGTCTPLNSTDQNNALSAPRVLVNDAPTAAPACPIGQTIGGKTYSYASPSCSAVGKTQDSSYGSGPGGSLCCYATATPACPIGQTIGGKTYSYASPSCSAVGKTHDSSYGDGVSGLQCCYTQASGSCSTNADCGSGYACDPQLNSCYKLPTTTGGGSNPAQPASGTGAYCNTPGTASCSGTEICSCSADNKLVCGACTQAGYACVSSGGSAGCKATGSTTGSLVITVDLKGSPNGTINNLQNGPITVPAGQQVYLSWTSTDTTTADSTCTASGAWSGSKGLSGTELLAVNTSGTYTITCTKTANGQTTTASDNVVVNVSGDTVLAFTLTLPGIGTHSGDNNSPKSTQRQAIVKISDSSGKEVKTASGQLVFNNTAFVGNVSLGSGFTTGTYTVEVKFNGTRFKKIAGQAITGSSSNTVAQKDLVSGDVDNNGTIDLADYNDMINCVKNLSSCTGNIKSTADFNDDSTIDLKDLNILLRGWQAQIRGE